jgi:pyruvate/2-oxoglutarate dehydrogenase complex dihydrolipoamide acyltransferase (E2) component
MTEGPAKTPVEQAVAHAVDLFVYAPIGLLFDGATLLPQLVERGRSQVSMARLIGRFAVGQGRTEASRAASRLQDQAAGVLGFIGDSVPVPSAERAPTAPTRPAASEATPTVATATTLTVAPAPPGPAAADLAIPDYDGLSASQVVNRLAGLSATELASVQRYEAANRGRKTILSKVAQLQGR